MSYGLYYYQQYNKQYLSNYWSRYIVVRYIDVLINLLLERAMGEPVTRESGAVSPFHQKVRWAGAMTGNIWFERLQESSWGPFLLKYYKNISSLEIPSSRIVPHSVALNTRTLAMCHRTLLTIESQNVILELHNVYFYWPKILSTLKL